MNNIETFPVCGCGISNKSEHSRYLQHEFAPISVLTRFEQDGKHCFTVDADDWPKKKIIGRCTFLECNRTMEQHIGVSHPWQGEAYEKRSAIIELPSDTRCYSCNIEPYSHIMRHPFYANVAISNKTEHDEISFVLTNGRSVLLTSAFFQGH